MFKNTRSIYPDLADPSTRILNGTHFSEKYLIFGSAIRPALTLQRVPIDLVRGSFFMIQVLNIFFK